MEKTMEKIKPVKITENFYQLGTPFFPVYLSIGDDAMLMEGGTGGAFNLVLDQLKEIGVEEERIKYIALTHSHSDHIGLVPHLMPRWEHTKLVGTEKAAELLRNEKVLEGFYDMDAFISQRLKEIGETNDLAPKSEGFQFEIDMIVDEGDKIDLGKGIFWNIYRIGGHSPCQIAFFEDSEDNLVVGDAAGLYFPKVDKFWPEYFVSLEQYCTSLKRMSELPGKRTALSHFGVIDGDSKTFLQNSLKATEAYHNEMLERTKNGEDPDIIANEKARWILTNHNYMTFEITEQMCKLLIKRSQKDADKEGLFA
ncbi:MAG: MBL fold metallo-hydrolase [Spirochaetes bacterium]|nr:MBL fold metallo-hydrolase [Spirochaetota bacterium]